MGGERKPAGTKAGDLVLSDRLIVDILVNSGPQTFGELKRKTRLSSATLSTHLKGLQARGIITREGRAIRLSGEYDSPEWKTAWSLSHYVLFPLDPFEAFEILRGPAGEALRVISSLGLNLEGKIKSECPFHPPVLFCYRETKRMLDEIAKRYSPEGPEVRSWELNEVIFLTGLGVLNAELEALENLVRAGEHEAFRLLLDSALEREGLESRREEAVRLLREGKDDWELFPALGVAKKLGALDGLLRLLRWVAPILDAHQGRPDGPLVLNRPTVPSIAFANGAKAHREQILCPLWRRRLGVKDAPD
jgi:DNA-binding Lrp family transcriptional regulator